MTAALTAVAIACAVGTSAPAASAAQRPGNGGSQQSSQPSSGGGGWTGPVMRPMRSSWS